jgi:hypothetical protein
MNSPEPTTSPPRAAALFVSVLFWAVLFAAAGLYALVVLAPKLAQREQLRTEYRGYRLELVARESRLLRMQSISSALQTDPQFAAELIRTQLKPVIPGEELIDVEESLALQTPLDDEELDLPSIYAPPPWYFPAVEVLAENDDARGVVLLAAVVLVLFAFGYLNDSLIEPARAATADAPPGSSGSWLERYRRDEPKPRPVNRLRSPLLDPSDDPDDDLLG